MAKYQNIVLTNAGLDMIAESQGGTALIFTAIKLGDGNLADNDNIKMFTAMKNPLLSVNISTVKVESIGQISLTATVNNSTVDTGFFARELGVFAKVGTTGTERLYAYTNAGNYADYMPDKTALIDENMIKITLITANASNVTAVINSSIVFTTIKEVEKEINQHNTDENAHTDIRAAINAAVNKLDEATVGDISYCQVLKKNHVKANGAVLKASEYPRLKNFVIENNLSVSEVDWQAGKQGMYLFNTTADTLRVPDLRGVAIRGLDDGKGYDTDRELGTYQPDMFKTHTHLSAQVITYNEIGHYGAETQYQNDLDLVVANQQTGATGGSETRMKNIAFIAQIKY